MIEIAKTVSLDAPIRPEDLYGVTFNAENKAHRFIITCQRNNADITLTGIVTAKLIRSDGKTILMQGSINTGKAVVDLHQDCYNVSGRFQLAIFNIASGTTTCIYACVGNVYPSQSSTLVDSGDVIPSVEEIAGAQATMISNVNTAIGNADAATTRANQAAATAENFTGLVAPTYSTSATYAVGDYVVYNGAMYRCITAVDTAEAWTAAHWTAVSTGAEVSDLKSAIIDLTKYNITNLVSLYTQKNKVYKGINYDWTDHSCYVHGTASSNSICDFIDTTNFDVFKKGETYNLLGASGAVHIRVYVVVDDNLTELVNATANVRFTIPSNATKLVIRLFVTSGNTVDKTVTPIITSNDWYISKGFANSKYTDADDISEKDLSIYHYNSANPLTHVPSNVSSGWIITIGWPYPLYSLESNANKAQICIPQYNYDIKYRVRLSGTWGDWKPFNSSYITEVTRDTYNNTYNITTTPTITTDSNGWLQPVDTDTADETGKTDMTGAIMSMLTNTGYCHLAPGIYYVSGGIDMPNGSMIEGCGDQTIIRLLQSVTSGYIIKMTTRCTIKNVHLSGGRTALDTTSSAIGGRIGLSFTGIENNKLCMVDGCWFKNLDSGIYGYNSGGSIQEGIIISNCYFHCCIAGINFERKVEYSKISNCVTYKCHYGCINNGGNNVFTGCTFHGIIGFLIDGTGYDQSPPAHPNLAHGSCVGCTFNHIANDIYPATLGGGDAVKIINLVSGGFIFTGCQFWYGNIDIQTGFGVQFSDCLFGGAVNDPVTSTDSPKLSVSGTYPAFFENCLFVIAPIKNLNSITKMDKCYLVSDGSAVTNS